MSKKCLSHKFEPYEKLAVGYWEKRQGAGDGIYVPGAVEECAGCGMMRLTPDDSRMRTVEVTR